MIRRYRLEDIDSIVELENRAIGSSLGKDSLINYLNNEMINIFFIYSIINFIFL